MQPLFNNDLVLGVVFLIVLLVGTHQSMTVDRFA